MTLGEQLYNKIAPKCAEDWVCLSDDLQRLWEEKAQADFEEGIERDESYRLVSTRGVILLWAIACLMLFMSGYVWESNRAVNEFIEECECVGDKDNNSDRLR